MGDKLTVLQRLLDFLRTRFTTFEQQSSLGRKFTFVLVPLVLIPMIATTAAAYVQSRNVMQIQLNTELTSRIDDKLNDISDWVSDREDQLNSDAQVSVVRISVTRLLQTHEGEAEFVVLQDALSNILDVLPESTIVPFDEYLVVRTSDGKILASTQNDWEGENIEADIMRALVLGENNTHAIYEHPLFKTSETEDFALLTQAYFSTNESGLNEALLLGLSTDSFKTDIIQGIQQEWLSSADKANEGMKAYLLVQPDVALEIDPSGTITVQHVNVNQPALTNPEISIPQTSEYQNIDGVSVLGSYAWLPEAGMGIALEMPRSVYLSEVNSFAPYSILFIFLAALFILFVVTITSNRLLRPLTNLSEFAQRMTRGDWEYRVPIESSDEVGTLSQSLNTMADELSQSYRSLEERVSDRTRQLRIASQVARVVISSPSLEDLLRRGVELIKSQFGYYHVSIFLIDEEGENAQLAESSGEVGQALKARGHSLKVGGQSIIGWVTANNQPRIAYDVTQDPLHLANELLPETRSEAAVPLQVAGHVLGVLDVQSTTPEAFAPQDIEILQTLADQFCAAIQNAKMAITSITAADRARLMSQVTQELSRQMTVEDVMQTTAKSLHRALGHPEIVVRMNAAETEASYYTEHPTSSDTDREA